MKKIFIVLAVCILGACGQNKTDSLSDEEGVELDGRVNSAGTENSKDESPPAETVYTPIPEIPGGAGDYDYYRFREEYAGGVLDQLSRDFLAEKIDIDAYYKKQAEGPKTVGAYLDIWEYIPFFETSPWKEKSKLALLDEQSALRFKAGEDLPKLDGATALYPVYAAFAHAVYPGNAIKTSYDGGQDDWPISFLTAPAIKAESEWETMRENTVVKCSRTRDAYGSLLNESVHTRPDIIFCYEPSAEQRAKAEKNGITLTMIPLGYDAFVFIVHKDNPVDNLTSEQIKAIYSGSISNWKSITGIDEDIIAYQRPKNSGSQTIMEQIMGDTPIMKPVTGLQPYGMADMVEAVSNYTNYKNSIGYSFRFFTNDMVTGSEIKILSVDGIYPSIENIQNKTYPFVQPFYAITAGNEKPNTRKFIDWMLSPQGQSLIKKTGYIPVSLFTYRTTHTAGENLRLRAAIYNTRPFTAPRIGELQGRSAQG
jgi:phosphate transport system substrate-binding protein